MSIDTITLTAEQVDQLSADHLLRVVGSLRDLTPDHSHNIEWADDQGQVWMLRTHGVCVGAARIIVWTDTDEAGINDVDVLECELDADNQVYEYGREIADDLGTVQD